MTDGNQRPISPEAIERMDAQQIDQLLTRLDPEVTSESTLVRIDPPNATAAAVVGDTHGDWRSAQAALEWFLLSPSNRAFVGLGDYVDRAPEDCPGGSVVNALYLLSVKAAHPDRVFLIQGNHEAARRWPVVPHTLPEEMAARWGEDRRRYSRLMGLLERGPLAGYTPNGVFFAHGGFPARLASPWTDRFRSLDETLLAELLWRDVAASRLDRGVSPPFDERDLEEFLKGSGLQVFLRGHDPDVVGRPLYHDRCLTLHTSRMFEHYGGILTVHLPLDRPIHSLRDVEVVHLSPRGSPKGGAEPRRTPARRNGSPPSSGTSDRSRAAGH